MTVAPPTETLPLPSTRARNRLFVSGLRTGIISPAEPELFGDAFKLQAGGALAPRSTRTLSPRATSLAIEQLIEADRRAGMERQSRPLTGHLVQCDRKICLDAGNSSPRLLQDLAAARLAGPA